MDIKSGCGYPGNQLTNFAVHPFEFDGVGVAGMEGLLQSFKFDKPHIQESVCELYGFAAKKRGSARNKAWKQKQTLWWKGVAYKRDSKEYQELLDRAFLAMARHSESFRKALIATGDANITHSIGKNKEADTVLTEAEFCRRLHWLRDLIKNEKL